MENIENQENKIGKEDTENFLSELKNLGVKFDVLLMKGAENIDMKELVFNPSVIYSRWKNLFKTRIEEFQISELQLKEWAETFSQKLKEIIEWLKKQPNPSQYEIVYAINPFVGEHVRIMGKSVIRVFGMTMRFERGGCELEFDKNFTIS